MGFSEKHQTEVGSESRAKKWVIAGMAVRSSSQLKAINTTSKSKERESEEELATTPTAKEARIPEILPCPPAPMKRRCPASKGNFNRGGGGGVTEFFIPPDLETVFVRHVERGDY